MKTAGAKTFYPGGTAKSMNSIAAIAMSSAIVVTTAGACGGSVEAIDEHAAVAKQQVGSTKAEAPPRIPNIRAAAPSEIPGPKVRGYVHLLAKSKAASTMGELRETQSAGNSQLVRYIGQHGTFVETSNGFSSFSLAPDVMLARSSRFPGERDAQKEFVKAYFAGGGLPLDQVGRIDEFAMIMATGVSSKVEADSHIPLGHDTKLNRQIDGVPVPESFAIARFNGEGDLVSEQVWWPELSEAVRKDASDFEAVLGNTQSAAAFRAALPPDAKGNSGALAIHHSLPLAGKWQETVTWDVPIGRSLAHFDRTGKQVQLHRLQ